jgi:hypothetical protein
MTTAAQRNADRRQAWSDGLRRTCAWCGMPFGATIHNGGKPQRFCTADCGERSRQRRRTTRRRLERARDPRLGPRHCRDCDQVLPADCASRRLFCAKRCEMRTRRPRRKLAAATTPAPYAQGHRFCRRRRPRPFSRARPRCGAVTCGAGHWRIALGIAAAARRRSTDRWRVRNQR